MTRSWWRAVAVLALLLGFAVAGMAPASASHEPPPGAACSNQFDWHRSGSNVVIESRIYCSINAYGADQDVRVQRGDAYGRDFTGYCRFDQSCNNAGRTHFNWVKTFAVPNPSGNQQFCWSNHWSHYTGPGGGGRVDHLNTGRCFTA